MFSKLKAAFALLLTLFVYTQAPAATVTWCATNFVAGATLNRATVLSQVANQLPSDGTYIVVGQPMRFPPTNTCWSTSLRYGCYKLEVEGFQFAKPLIFCVPDDSNTYTVSQLAGLSATNMPVQGFVRSLNGLATNLTVNSLTATGGILGGSAPLSISSGGWPLFGLWVASGAFGQELTTTGAVSAEGLISGNSGVLTSGSIVGYNFQAVGLGQGFLGSLVTWTNGTASGTNQWKTHLFSSSLAFVPNNNGNDQITFGTNGVITSLGLIAGGSFTGAGQLTLLNPANGGQGVITATAHGSGNRSGMIFYGTNSSSDGGLTSILELRGDGGSQFSEGLTWLLGGTTNNADGFWGNGIGLTNLQLKISGTNATPPVNTSTIKAWADVVLPDGNTFKTPLYK